MEPLAAFEGLSGDSLSTTDSGFFTSSSTLFSGAGFSLSIELVVYSFGAAGLLSTCLALATRLFFVEGFLAIKVLELFSPVVGAAFLACAAFKALAF